jgi:hypothetical protein
MADEDAKQIIKNQLERYGLGSLTDRAWGLLSNETISADAGIDVIGDALRDTQEFKDRFPSNAARLRAGLPELSVSEYVGLERGYEAAMRGSGLPAGFYDDPTDFANFISSNTSVAEVQSRVNDGYKAVADSNPQVIAQMKELYGVGDGELAAYFLDPQRATPILVRQARAAQISAEGKRQAGIQLSVSDAEALAREDVSPSEAQAGFGQVNQQKELYTPMQAGEEQISQQEAIGAALGTDQAAKQRVETRKRQRQAQFAGGGAFVSSASGTTGLAEAQ